MIISIKLKLKVIEEKEDKIKFKIDHQSEELRYGFLAGSYIAGNNTIEVRSSFSPSVDEPYNTFYIRGAAHSKDNDKMMCSKEFYNKIQKIVSKINNKNQFKY